MFTYDGTVQNDIALILAARTYSSMTTDQKLMVDNGWTSGTVDGGAVRMALDKITPRATFYTMDSNLGIPDKWRTWVIFQAAAAIVHQFDRADKDSVYSQLSDHRRTALMEYTRSNPESTTESAHLAGTLLSLRQFVDSNSLRLPRPLLPEPLMIDQAMQEVLHHTWNFANWSFRKQTMVLTIGTDGSVSAAALGGGSLIIKKITSEAVYFTGSSDNGAMMLPADAELMLQLTAQDIADGRPEFFRLLADQAGADDGVRWQLDRTPDQEYTARCEAMTAIGPMTTPAEMDSVLATFPVGMIPYLKKKTLATVLENSGRSTKAAEIDRECDQMLRELVEQESPLEDTEVDQRRQRRSGLGTPFNSGGFV